MIYSISKKQLAAPHVEQLKTRFAQLGVSLLFHKREQSAPPDLMFQQSILDVFEKELRTQGFVGSADVPKLVFLCLQTRHFDQPVSMVIKGSSGSGKSYALKMGLSFVPPAAYELYAGMSERALIYNEKLKLKHRYLVIQEAAGLNDGVGRVFLRQLLSEGKVRYATVQSTKDGLVGKDLPPLEGPTGLLMTTTANALHAEDESRMLSYHLEESPQRMREALVQQALLRARPPMPIDTAPWFALDEYVRTHDKKVDIPFLASLGRKMPTSHNRAMRDFPQLTSLIEAYALVHQCKRERSRDGKVVATVDDYAAVRQLLQKPLSEGFEKAVPQNVREVVETVKALLAEKQLELDPFQAEFGNGAPAGVSQREVAQALDRDRSVISRNVGVAIDQGFLEDLNPGQGRKSHLVIGEQGLPSGSVLPDPAELELNPRSRTRLGLSTHQTGTSSTSTTFPSSQALGKDQTDQDGRRGRRRSTKASSRT